MKNINWKKHEFENLDEAAITPEIAKEIIAKNSPLWEDGTEIAEDELVSDFIMYRYENGEIAITMKNEDYYITIK